MRFSDIIGHENIKEQLIRTVRENRISHAQLFLGPEGNGKLSLAIAYAQFINCRGREKDDIDSCGKCPSCKKYDELAHPDLHFIYPISTTRAVDKKPTSLDFIEHWRELLLSTKGYINLPLWYNKIEIENKQGIINADDCNDIIRTLGYKAYEAEYKVMIIWMVEKLYHAAAPKLLKILEEPTDKTLFLLVAQEYDQIISTIQSRTQLVKVPRISNEALQQALVKNYGFDHKEARNAALIAEGNLIEAIELLNATGSDDFFVLFRQWMRLCFTAKVEPINEWINAVSKMGREKQKAFLIYSLSTLRLCLTYHHRPEEVLLEGEQKEFMQKFSPRINHKNIGELYKLFNKGVYHVERNANPALVFMDTSLKVSHLIRNV